MGTAAGPELLLAGLKSITRFALGGRVAPFVPEQQQQQRAHERDFPDCVDYEHFWVDHSKSVTGHAPGSLKRAHRPSTISGGVARSSRRRANISAGVRRWNRSATNSSRRSGFTKRARMWRSVVRVSSRFSRRGMVSAMGLSLWKFSVPNGTGRTTRRTRACHCSTWRGPSRPGPLSA